MKHLVRMAVVLVGIVLFCFVLAQDKLTFSGQLAGWEEGEADIALNLATNPPAPTLTEDATIVGAINADGSFSFTLPNSMPEETLIRFDELIGGDQCEELRITPQDAMVAPVGITVYRDGELTGGLFRSNADYRGAGPPEFQVIVGYTPGEVTVRARCARTASPEPFVQEFDFTVGPGWHHLVNRLSAGPSLATFKNEPVPESSTWMIFRPPPPPPQ